MREVIYMSEILDLIVYHTISTSFFHSAHEGWNLHSGHEIWNFHSAHEGWDFHSACEGWNFHSAQEGWNFHSAHEDSHSLVDLHIASFKLCCMNASG